MNLRHIWIIFRKEIRDIVRDRKTLLMSIGIPLVIIPVMYLFMGNGVEKLQKDINENVTIALAENSNTAEIRALVKDEIIRDNKNIRLVDVKNPLDEVRKGNVRAVLEFEKDFGEKLGSGKTFVIKLMYDKSRTKSEGSLGILNSAIDEFNSRTVAQRLIDRGINPEILEPAKIEETNVADVKKSGNDYLGMLLPMLIVMFIATGGIPAATDLVAGEKERNTLEPLLTTKPKRASILAGKYLTVMAFSFITIVSTFAGYIISFMISPASLTMGSGQDLTGFYVPPVALILTVLTAMMLGLIFAGVQITLSTFAKSFKEAQTYMGYLTIFIMLPAFSTMFTQANDIPSYMYIVPIMNTISAIKSVLSGTIVYMNLLLALVSSIVFVVATLALSAWMFSREKVLFRS